MSLPHTAVTLWSKDPRWRTLVFVALAATCGWWIGRDIGSGPRAIQPAVTGSTADTVSSAPSTATTIPAEAPTAAPVLQLRPSLREEDVVVHGQNQSAESFGKVP
jgi:hypothetical protein